jgi:sRNA-binding regulator protein Hfq
MLKKSIAIMFSLLLLLTATNFQSTHAQAGAETQRAEKARASVARRGTGKDARVEVTLLNNTKLKGYISEAGNDSFTVIDRKTGASQVVAYTDVSQVKKSGGGLSTKTLIILGAVAAGVIITAIIVKPAFCDGGAQTRFPC